MQTRSKKLEDNLEAEPTIIAETDGADKNKISVLKIMTEEYAPSLSVRVGNVEAPSFTIDKEVIQWIRKIRKNLLAFSGCDVSYAQQEMRIVLNERQIYLSKEIKPRRGDAIEVQLYSESDRCTICGKYSDAIVIA